MFWPSAHAEPKKTPIDTVENIIYILLKTNIEAEYFFWLAWKETML